MTTFLARVYLLKTATAEFARLYRSFFALSLSFLCRNPTAMNMASYQQRIPLKGTEDSIDYFTDVLRSTKDQVGVNSAEVLLRAMVFWHHGGGFRFLQTCASICI